MTRPLNSQGRLAVVYTAPRFIERGAVFDIAAKGYLRFPY
jgi:hypothetical protein